MEIVPAIDILGGKCVRLRQGDYSQETVFGDDPAVIAHRWAETGAKRIHLVDLDGARQGRPVNGEAIRAAVRAVNSPCQLGGGLRTESDIQMALDWGIDRVILGTKALADPLWIRGVCELFPGRIVIGIDAKDGRVAANGWLEVSERTALELAKQVAAWPIAAIVYTDIQRDGMLNGPNFAAYREIKAEVPVPIYASGGISSIDDLRELAQIGVDGCVIGRALYEGQIDLREALDCGI